MSLTTPIDNALQQRIPGDLIPLIASYLDPIEAEIAGLELTPASLDELNIYEKYRNALVCNKKLLTDLSPKVLVLFACKVCTRLKPHDQPEQPIEDVKDKELLSEILPLLKQHLEACKEMTNGQLISLFTLFQKNGDTAVVLFLEKLFLENNEEKLRQLHLQEAISLLKLTTSPSFAVMLQKRLCNLEIEQLCGDELLNIVIYNSEIANDFPHRIYLPLFFQVLLELLKNKEEKLQVCSDSSLEGLLRAVLSWKRLSEEKKCAVSAQFCFLILNRLDTLHERRRPFKIGLSNFDKLIIEIKNDYFNVLAAQNEW